MKPERLPPMQLVQWLNENPAAAPRMFSNLRGEVIPCFGVPGKFYKTYEEWWTDNRKIHMRIHQTFVPMSGEYTLYTWRIKKYREQYRELKNGTDPKRIIKMKILEELAAEAEEEKDHVS